MKIINKIIKKTGIVMFAVILISLFFFVGITMITTEFIKAEPILISEIEQYIVFEKSIIGNKSTNNLICNPSITRWTQDGFDWENSRFNAQIPPCIKKFTLGYFTLKDFDLKNKFFMKDIDSTADNIQLAIKTNYVYNVTVGNFTYEEQCYTDEESKEKICNNISIPVMLSREVPHYDCDEFECIENGTELDYYQATHLEEREKFIGKYISLEELTYYLDLRKKSDKKFSENNPERDLELAIIPYFDSPYVWYGIGLGDESLLDGDYKVNKYDIKKEDDLSKNVIYYEPYINASGNGTAQNTVLVEGNLEYEGIAEVTKTDSDTYTSVSIDFEDTGYFEIIDDMEDVSEWIASLDGIVSTADSFVKEGSYSMNLSTDISAGAGLTAKITSETDYGDVSDIVGVDTGVPTRGFVDFWINVTSGINLSSNQAIILTLGSSSSNYRQYWFHGNELTLDSGNYLHRDLTTGNASSGSGGINWSTNFDYISFHITNNNTNDFDTFIDSFQLIDSSNPTNNTFDQSSGVWQIVNTTDEWGNQNYAYAQQSEVNNNFFSDTNINLTNFTCQVDMKTTTNLAARYGCIDFRMTDSTLNSEDGYRACIRTQSASDILLQSITDGSFSTLDELDTDDFTPEESWFTFKIKVDGTKVNMSYSTTNGATFIDSISSNSIGNLNGGYVGLSVASKSVGILHFKNFRCYSTPERKGKNTTYTNYNITAISSPYMDIEGDKLGYSTVTFSNESGEIGTYGNVCNHTNPLQVLCMPFEGCEDTTITDMSGNESDGTNYGATPSCKLQNKNPIVGEYMSFDGNGYIQLTSDINWYNRTENNYTLSFWLKADNITDDLQSICGDGAVADDYILFRPVSNHFRIEGSNTGAYDDFNYPASLDETIWHNYIFTFIGGTNNMTLYVDKEYADSELFIDDLLINLIGDGYSVEYLKGSIDELTIELTAWDSNKRQSEYEKGKRYHTLDSSLTNKHNNITGNMTVCDINFNCSSDSYTIEIENTKSTIPDIVFPLTNNNYSLTNISLNVSSSDADNDLIYYYHFINNSLNSTTITNSTFNGTDGTWNYSVMAYDGEEFSNNISIIFTLDTTPPAINLEGPLNNTYLNVDTTIFYYNVSDNLLEISVCRLFINDIFNETNYTITKGISQNFTNHTISDGSYNWTVECNDTVGNAINSSYYYFTIDTTNPVITTISPENNSIDTDGIVTPTYNVTDTNNITQCRIFIDNQLNDTNNSINKSMPSIHFTTYRLPEKDHNFTVECTDQADNRVNSSYVFFTVRFPIEEVTRQGGGYGGGMAAKCEVYAQLYKKCYYLENGLCQEGCQESYICDENFICIEEEITSAIEELIFKDSIFIKTKEILIGLWGRFKSLFTFDLQPLRIIESPEEESETTISDSLKEPGFVDKYFLYIIFFIVIVTIIAVLLTYLGWMEIPIAYLEQGMNYIAMYWLYILIILIIIISIFIFMIFI